MTGDTTDGTPGDEQAGRPVTHATPSGTRNWAGNVTFGAARVHSPTSLGELQEIVGGAERVRALGTGHSFNRIADTPADLVSVARLPEAVAIDHERAQATVSAGMRYAQVCRALDDSGYALHNLGSLPHISVAGACATGTHGSGVTNANLAAAVAGVEWVAADGSVASLARGDAGFDGAVLSLGMLGVATRLTLDLEPSFTVRQDVYEDMPLGRLATDLDEIVGSAYSVSLFTDWTSPSFNQVWLKRRTDAPERPTPRRWMDAHLADGPRHPVPGMPAGNCTEQMGKPGPWYQRLPHFRPDLVPSAGDELQTEYLVARPHALAAVEAVAALAPRIAPVLQICELRTVARDELWLSPSYRRDTFAVHFTWTSDVEAVMPVVRDIEAALAPVGALPHWGKVFTTAPEVIRAGFERLDDARRLRQRYDPGAKFTNAFVETYV